MELTHGCRCVVVLRCSADIFSSALVQAPVTPNSPEAQKPPNSRRSPSDATGAAGGSGWASRMRSMWPGSSAQPATFSR